MAGVKTTPIPRTSQMFTRNRNILTNRCISSNITMIHSDDGKPAVITKQSTFSVPGINNHTGVINVTRVEEHCGESPFADNATETSDRSGATSSASSSSHQSSEFPSAHLPSVRVKSFCARTSHDALRLALRKLEWKEQSKADGTYDIYWHGLAYEDTCHNNATEIHAINKLPGMLELSHKVQLSRILKRMQTLYPGEFDFYPPTWVIPEQLHQFVGEVGIATKRRNGRQTPVETTIKKADDNQTFIVKPDQGRQGEGIYLVTDPRDVHAEFGTRPAIVQKYIDSPLLLEGYKFDLRIYVVIARLDPIEIYICKEGLARLCTAPYETPNKQNVRNAFMHLTNYSLNKNSEDFIQTDEGATGSKRTLTSVQEILARDGHDVKRMRKEIKQLAVKTILAVYPDLAIWSHASGISKDIRCFQILGFDVMLSSDMKAHLLEVNAVPSLRIDAEREVESMSGVYETVISAVDEQVKVTLIKDSLELVALGEDNLDMTESCLKRIFPLKTQSDLLRSSQIFKQRVRMCDKRCLEHNTHGNAKVTANQRSRHAINENHHQTDRVSTSWTCNRYCPNCYAAIRKPQPPYAPTVVQYKTAEGHSFASDWRFFDHEFSGSTLLMTERQPFVNTVRYKNAHAYQPTPPEGESQEDHKSYEQCSNCGGYLNAEVGPGIMEQRQPLGNQTNVDKHQAQPINGTFSYNHHEAENGTPMQQNFKLAPPHTNLALPRYVVNERRVSYEKKVWMALADSPTDSKKTAPDETRQVENFMSFKKTKTKSNDLSSFSGYHVMLLRRCAKVFMYFNGIKSTLTMGATAFRNMARKCNLCDQGALPSIDILFIDALRQWQSYRAAYGTPYYIQNNESKSLKSKKAYLRQTSGLPFHGFVEALFRIAMQRYSGDNLRDKLECLILGCERYISRAKKIEKAEKIRQRERNGTLLSPWKQQPSLRIPHARIGFSNQRLLNRPRRSGYMSQ